MSRIVLRAEDSGSGRSQHRHDESCEKSHLEFCYPPLYEMARPQAPGQEAYAPSEVAINWNAPLVFQLAGALGK